MKQKKLEKLFTQGLYTEIVKILEDVQKRSLFEDNALAGAYIKLKNPEKAKTILEGLIKKNNQNQHTLNNLATIYKDQKDLELAEKYYKKSLQVDPEFEAALFNLALVYQQAERVGEAEQILKKLCKKHPNNAEYKFNLANIYFSEDKQDLAEALYAAADKLRPVDLRALHNLGNTYIAARKFDLAIKTFSDLVIKDPDNAMSHIGLGVSFQQIRKHEEAIECFAKANKLDGQNVLSLNGHSRSLLYQNKFSEAIEINNLALKIDHLNEDTWFLRIELHEKNNRLDDLRKIIELIPDEVAKTPTMMVQRAFVLWRLEEYQESKSLLENIVIETLKSYSMRQRHSFLKAEVNHSLHSYKQAALDFRKANEQVIADHSSEFSESSKNYIEGYQERLKSLKYPLLKCSNRNTQDNRIFLVGFPRSGTTLLDTFLRGHSETEVIEEKPIINEALLESSYERFVTISDLDAAPQEWKEKLAENYNRALEKYSANERKVKIDKLPLNILRLPEIANAFPSAKIILAIRHPLDCVLSNYRQNYSINDPMYLMSEISSIYSLYDCAMKTFFYSVERYSLNFIISRYEDLIADKRKSLIRISKFLDIEYEESMSDHQATALLRGKINTPSYKQVVKPIYNKSKNLWKNYEELISPIPDHMKRWIDLFGYGEED